MRRFSSELDIWMMKLTMKFRMPGQREHMSADEEGRKQGEGVVCCRTETLVAWEHLPSGHDNIVKHLQAEV